MKVLQTFEFDLKSDPQCCTNTLPVSLGNLNGEESKHMSMFIPNEEGEILPPHGKYKNYYLKHIGNRSPTMPIHKTLKGLSKKGFSSKVSSSNANLVLKNLVSGNFHVSFTIGVGPDDAGREVMVSYLVVSTDVELDSQIDPEVSSMHSLPDAHKNDVFAMLFMDIPGGSLDPSRGRFDDNVAKVRQVRFSQEITNSVDSKLLTIIERYVMHLTFRHYGLTIAKSSLKAFEMAIIHIMDSWKNLEDPPCNLLLDAMIICQDVLLLCEGRDSNVRTFRIVSLYLGLILEAQDRYCDAAWIHIDNAIRWGRKPQPLPFDNIIEARSFFCAGDSFKNSGEVSKAEWCFIRAWKIVAPLGLDNSMGVEVFEVRINCMEKIHGETITNKIVSHFVLRPRRYFKEFLCFT